MNYERNGNLFLQFPSCVTCSQCFTCKNLKLRYWAPDLARFRPESSLAMNQNRSLSGVNKDHTHHILFGKKYRHDATKNGQTTVCVCNWRINIPHERKPMQCYLNNLTPGKAMYWSVIETQIYKYTYRCIYIYIICQCQLVSIILHLFNRLESILIKSSHATQR